MFRPSPAELRHIAILHAHCGLKPDGTNRVYALAAVRLGIDGSRADFESLVSYAHLGAREHYRSGVTQKALANAPSWTSVRRNLRDFLSDCEAVLVLEDDGAMDAIRPFLMEKRIVDMGFAAEFFLPQLSAFSLKNLQEFLTGEPREKVSFPTSEAVDLGVNFLRHLTGTVLNADHARHAAFLRFFLRRSQTLFGDLFLHLHEHFQEFFGGLFAPDSDEETDRWRFALERVDRNLAGRSQTGSFKPVSLETIETRYRELAEALPNFRYRPEQVQYAREIAEALNGRTVLTIEAGTGTGKTQGYLIPVLEFLRRNPGRPVVISTYTKSLQEQVFHREIAFATAALPFYQDLRAALLKGKSSYLCAEKLDALYDPEMSGPRLLAWAYALHLLFHFRTADADGVGQRVRDRLDGAGGLSRLLRDASARSGCTPAHGGCPAQIVASEARAADLIVTNHHKLALLDRDNLLSGRFTRYIVDEANHFETAIRNALGRELSSREIRDALDHLETWVRRALPKAKAPIGDRLEDGLSVIQEIREDLAGFRGALPRRGNRPADEVDLPPGEEENESVRALLERMADVIGEVYKELQPMGDPDVARELNIPTRTRRRIAVDLETLESAVETLREIALLLRNENTIAAAKLFPKNWLLTARSVEVAPTIRKRIYAHKNCVVFTAATLRHRGRFDSFQAIAGMNEPETIEREIEPLDFRFAAIPSPFGNNGLEIVVPEDAESGRYDNKAAWTESVVRALPRLIRENKGRTLVLFSSYRDLDHVAERVRDEIAETRYPLLIQRPGQPTVGLCDEFRAIKESVLFGVETFWYGVDFRGDTLTQVVITRIPYPPPSDPLQVARKRLLPSAAFWDRYRYDTDIKLRQGIGRLIRSDTDRGRVVVLDSRYRNAPPWD
ncbi:MAG: ATP-dependent DNA helicase [Desulfococcaceae bacterium]